MKRNLNAYSQDIFKDTSCLEFGVMHHLSRLLILLDDYSTRSARSIQRSVEESIALVNSPSRAESLLTSP